MSANIVYQHFSTVNTLVLNFNKKTENFRPCIATHFLYCSKHGNISFNYLNRYYMILTNLYSATMFSILWNADTIDTIFIIFASKELCYKSIKRISFIVSDSYILIQIFFQFHIFLPYYISIGLGVIASLIRSNNIAVSRLLWIGIIGELCFPFSSKFTKWDISP